MRFGLCKHLQFCLLISSLWLFASACQDDSTINLKKDSSFLIMPEALDQAIDFKDLKNLADFRTAQSIDHLDAYPSAWIKYEIPNIASIQRPTLMVGLCGSLDKIAWGDQLLADFNLKNTSPLDIVKSQKPYFLLNTNQENQTLYFRVLRSERTGFQPSCRELIVASESQAVKRFILFQSLEVLTSVIILFLAAMSGFIWFFKREPIFLHFFFFTTCIGLTFVSLAHPVHFAIPGVSWILLWNISMMLVPPSFLGFFYWILPTRIPLLRIMALLNYIPLLIGIILWSSGNEAQLGRLRMLFFLALAPQIIFTLVIAGRHLLRAAFPAPILALGLITLLLGAAVDTLSYVLNLAFIQGTCIALIFFMGFLISYLILLHIDKEKQLEKERTQNLEDYSKKLAIEVEQRSQVLHVKTEELELSNSELEEKNVLLSISHRRLEDLIGQKDALLKKVAEINQDLLPSLLESLTQLYINQDRTSLQSLSIEAHKIASQLEPVARLHSNNEALKSRNIWLLEPEKQLLLVTKMALGGSRVEIKSFLNPDEFTLALTQEKPDLAVISTDFSNFPQLLHLQYPEVATVLTTKHELSHHIDLLATHPSLCHVIYQDNEERTLTQKNLLVTVTKILSNDIFGLEKYLNWGVDVKEYIITSSHNRSQFLEIVESELSKAGILTSHIRNATLITDEILMNAIYDAPVDRQTGQSKYNHLSRRVMVELEPTEYGKLRFAFDGSTIALSVHDPFGALKRETITRYLKSCFDGHFGKINEHEGKGGGGMGLFQIISTADLMITNIKPGERTEIIALLNVAGKTQARKRHGSFHYFVER